jgi:Protein of unknown function (DUF2800).
MNELIVRPSALSLTIACTASLQLQAKIPEAPPTEEEQEGTAAHWVAMRYAAGYSHELPQGTKFTLHGREWTVDEDMAAGALMYLRTCGGSHTYLRLEDAVACRRVHPTHCYGTPDAWRYFLDAREAFALGPPPEFPVHEFAAGRIKLLRLPDYKYGHRYVEVFENPQLAAYVDGVIERLQLDEADPNLWVEFIIVQPRAYHRDGPVRTWRGRASDLRGILNVAWSAAHEALGPNPIARTNDACVDCKARHVCSVLQRANYSLIDFSGTAEVVELPAEAVGQELAMVEDAIERLKARATGLSAQAEALIRQGKRVSHYHMEQGESRMIYREDVTLDEVVGFGDLIGIDLRKPQTLKEQLVTPTQAIKLGVDAGAMKAFAWRPPAAYKLTRDDSTLARKVFDK